MNKVLCDTDILSALAKAKALYVLEIVFPEHNFLITEHVREELQKSMDAGFDFPKKIFKLCHLTTLKKSELKEYEQLDLPNLSETDVKNIVIAKERDISLITNDSALYTEAKKRGISTFDLRQILRAAYDKEKLSRKEAIKILQQIEEKDNTFIKDKGEIFKD